jgi:mono/diheme cytochrome c family protein
MDFQPKFKSQQRNIFFADQRAGRPQVPGTVARGQFAGGDEYYLGVNAGQALASLQDPTAAPPANADGQPPSADAPGGDEVAPGGASAPPPAGMNENQSWADEIPVPVTDELMARGRTQFGVYCAPCHGLAGYGDGLVNQRALTLKEPTWVPVPSLHTVQTRNRPDGYIYRAITDGVRKMPAYGSQIEAEDRWAVVLYVRALQRSQGAPAR